MIKVISSVIALTSDGVSPRPIPGVKGGIHHITGVEHNEEGKPSESASNRQQQMEKRMRKIEQLLIESPVEANLQHEDADILYIVLFLQKVQFKKVVTV